MRVVVIRHHDVDTAGFIADAFEARGAHLDVHLFPDDGPLPGFRGVDHIVVMGAVSSVNDPDPWIAKEIGWFTVDSADEDAVPAGPWLEFHNDRCLLPAQATVLARNEAAVQAFRIGRHFAVQFHPEVDGPQLKRWLDSMGTAEVESTGLDPDQFLADTIREEPAARARADRLVATALAIKDS